MMIILFPTIYSVSYEVSKHQSDIKVHFKGYLIKIFKDFQRKPLFHELFKPMKPLGYELYMWHSLVIFTWLKI